MTDAVSLRGGQAVSLRGGAAYAVRPGVATGATAHCHRSAGAAVIVARFAPLTIAANLRHRQGALLPGGVAAPASAVYRQVSS
ncbi:MAG: hypothetical protein Q4G22_08350 [Paracoccus sp. (in: a-proteobacteria)]|uniref:hypothetical protein n=1 Tax=Paracoccus sp. TaxID=267 RepID=UPI0026DF442F|nr:hypothetical protein [Paracoccus sp. (in: a-proteobacteria)]MDO5631834.1 hypothetical protein [Paracoccus sp. (in: a-proteobacteria)]